MIADWWRSNETDDDADFLYNCGEEDALSLISPQQQDYYYLQGWQDTKRKLASGELCEEFDRIQSEIEAAHNWTYTDEWEAF
jgi:L-lactate utilization protein LutC